MNEKPAKAAIDVVQIDPPKIPDNGVGLSTKDQYVIRPKGCICPPTAEQTCENQLCPRKAIPGFSLSGGDQCKS